MIRLTPDPVTAAAPAAGPIGAEPLIARAVMEDADAICTRMAQDLNALRHEAGGVRAAHLIDLGWSARQITTHLLEAIDRASKDWRLTSYSEAIDEVENASCSEAVGEINLASSSEAVGEIKEPVPCA